MLRMHQKDMLATLKLSAPIIVGQLGHVMMGTIDNIMIGRVGAASLAAAGVSNAVFFIVAIFGIGIFSILSPLVAAAKSAKDHVKCNILLRSGVALGGILALLLGSLILFLAFRFYWFKQTAEVEILSRSYLMILALSLVPMMLFVPLKQFCDGLSYTKISMYVTLMGVVLNIFLNWLLIYGHWGFPELGLDGAGWATFMVRLLMLIVLVLIVRYRKVFLVYVRIYKEEKIDLDRYWTSFKKIMQLGVPSGLQYFFEIAAFAGAAIMIGWMDEFSLAAHQIAISLAAITYMVASGIAMAGGIRVGDAVGLLAFEQMQRAGTAAFLLTFLFMSVGSVLFLTFPADLVSLYIEDLRVAEKAIPLLIIAGFFQLSDGIQATALGVLRGISDTKIPTYITLVAYWFLSLPVGYYLGFEKEMGASGLWIGFLIGLTFAAILLTLRFYMLLKNKSYRKTFSATASS